MGVSLKLANLWRVIREVDLHAVRQAAQTPFEILLVDEGDGQAMRLRALLSPETRAPHPWLRTTAASNFELAAPLAPPAAAILITSSVDLSPAMHAALTRSTVAEAYSPTDGARVAGAPARRVASRARCPDGAVRRLRNARPV